MPAEAVAKADMSAEAVAKANGRGIYRRAGTTIFWLAFAALVAIRIPSLAQPAGGDQGLYWYIGQRIAHGEIPYRDAWDQKPPGIHFAYALLTSVWPHESAVPGIDLLVSTLVALLLVHVGRRVSPTPGVGEAAALIFLALGNPVVTRLGGARVRAQCETFIALATSAAVFALRDRLREPRDPPAVAQGFSPAERASQAGTRVFVLAGLAAGVAIVFKYNAAAYLAVPAFAWLLDRSRRIRDLAALGAGVAAPLVSMAAFFALHGAWRDLVDATIAYNVQYSGETYASAGAFAKYLLTFPFWHSRIDALWLVGCAGCAVLLALAVRSPRLLLGPVWVAAACLAIAINGSRDLQQYFVQAGPALAFSAGLAGSIVWSKLRLAGRVILLLVVATAVWRVMQIPKGIEYTAYDWRALRGASPREAYLSRFGTEGSGDKYSALAMEHLVTYLGMHTAPSDRIFIFGFSGAAYAKAARVSASRFFWSRPVIVEFKRGDPRYGPEGLLADLTASHPACVVLQARDWDPDTIDSLTYFHRTAALDTWLRAHYRQADRLGNYEIWLETSPTSSH